MSNLNSGINHRPLVPLLIFVDLGGVHCFINFYSFRVGPLICYLLSPLKIAERSTSCWFLVLRSWPSEIRFSYVKYAPL